MIFIATYCGKGQSSGIDVEEKARKWWNGGECPAGLRLLACYRPVSSDEPGVMIFEADSSDDIAKLVSYWREWSFSVRPATDELAAWRAQGMKV